MLVWTLFWEFCKVGLFCVGGGYASMPLIQAAVVDTYQWMSLSEFVDIFTISQMTPGPIVVNSATFIGLRIFRKAAITLSPYPSASSFCVEKKKDGISAF